MMYRRGKSDSVIVAAKPTNKAGQPAAESVERRAGAEGNAVQQSTIYLSSLIIESVAVRDNRC